MSRRLDKTEDAAAAWDARLRGAKATFRDRRAFQAWLEEDAANLSAHTRLQAALSTLRANAELPELSALRDEARNNVHENRRRRLAAMVVLGVAATLLLMAMFVPRTERGAELVAMLHGDTIYATAPDERNKVTLADGSVVTLDSGTRLAVNLKPQRRDITLLTGRALFHVAKDKHRPFVVRAGDRTVTALGTVFDVNFSSSELRVTLAEGSVAIRPVAFGHGATQQILKPRQQFIALSGAAAPEMRTVDTDKELSWADGQLFFENESLASAVEEMNRYSQRKILVDPGVAGLRINGMFRTGNQAGFLEALQVTLPVSVRAGSDGRIMVSGRIPGSNQEGEGM